MLGLITVAQLSSAGAGQVVVIDPNRDRLQLAEAFGATAITSTKEEAALAFLTTYHTQYPFADLVSKTFSLEQVEEAFAYAQTHHPVCVAVIP